VADGRRPLTRHVAVRCIHGAGAVAWKAAAAATTASILEY
jgi:hypothetical protein